MENFVENIQSELRVKRAKRIYFVLFSEKVVLYRQPIESVIFSWIRKKWQIKLDISKV